MLILCLILTINVTSIISLASEINSPSGCNYIVDDNYLPASNSFSFYKTSSTPSVANNAISSAINTWNNVTSSMQFTLNSGTKALDVNDSYNTIGSLLSADEFAAITNSYTYVAATYHNINSNGRMNSFDIFLNSSYAFGNGQNNSYNDYQGIFTHELGHVWGLRDVYETSTQFNVNNVNELPTMFGAVNYSGYSGNISILLRDLRTGDINGLLVIKELCGF